MKSVARRKSLWLIAPSPFDRIAKNAGKYWNAEIIWAQHAFCWVDFFNKTTMALFAPLDNISYSFIIVSNRLLDNNQTAFISQKYLQDPDGSREAFA